MIASRPSIAIAIAVAPLTLLVTGSAAAQGSPPEITLRASASQVESEEPLVIELKAMTERGSAAPSDPEIRAPREFAVNGPSLSTQTFINGFGPRSTVKIGIGATWQLVAKKPGHYVIPAPTVLWNGKRYAAQPITVDVTPSTGGSRRQRSNNPFLMPGGPGMGFPFNNFPFSNRAPQIEDDDIVSDTGASPELAMAAAPDPAVFMRSIVDKKTAVIGEQVTLSTYAYFRYEARVTESHEAPMADFVRVPLLKNPGTEKVVTAMAGGHRYMVKLFDRVAIFPMHAGDLHTGAMRVTFAGPRVGQNGLRETEDQVIRVTEPPIATRPAGYAMGDVGQFKLTAGVQPRRVDQGGSVAVTLRVTGTGNLPETLHVPERNGVEWLDPEKKESIEPQDGQIAGWRTFGYVVRIKNAGTVDLGEVALPYWDPAARRYQIARAPLGAIEVAPTMPALDASGKVPPSAVDAPRVDPFAALPAARATLGAYTPARSRLFDGRAPWFLIAAPPVLVGLASAATGALSRSRSRRAARKDSPAALAERALGEARAAHERGDVKALAAAAERAIHLAVEGGTGLKSRGVLVADLPGELAERGVPQALADDIAAALAACDVIRFDPSPAPETTRDLASRTGAVVAALARSKAP